MKNVNVTMIVDRTQLYASQERLEVIAKSVNNVNDQNAIKYTQELLATVKDAIVSEENDVMRTVKVMSTKGALIDFINDKVKENGADISMRNIDAVSPLVHSQGKCRSYVDVLGGMAEVHTYMDGIDNGSVNLHYWDLDIDVLEDIVVELKKFLGYKS